MVLFIFRLWNVQYWIQYITDSYSCIRKWIYLKLAYEANFVSFNEAPNSFMSSNEDFCSMFLETQYISSTFCILNHERFLLAFRLW